MTSKTSLFNFGIFKTTLRRFMWGSIAYFVMLFMSTCFPIMMEEEQELLLMRYNYIPYLIQQLEFPKLTTIAVPLVVSLLIFRFIHSKGQNIFTHSLPVSRGANYFSSLLAGFVLMAVPVILNGMGLYILHFSYSKLIEPYHCVLWTGILLFSLFVMFSIAVFASVLTGNSFMAVFLYAFINALPLIILWAYENIYKYLVHGFATNGQLADFAEKYTPVSWILNSVGWRGINVTYIPVICYIVFAVVVYILSYLLYRVRKSEKTGEVMAFRCMNPVLKYLITALVSILMLIVLVENYNASITAMVVFLLLASAVGYFVCEMVLKKSVRVFRAYKGYIGFCVVSVLLIGVIHFTGGFGYSTRIPEAEQVDHVFFTSDFYYSSSYTYMDTVFVDEASINKAVDIHKEFVDNGSYSYSKRYLNDNLCITYVLKNGTVIERCYYIPHERYLHIEDKFAGEYGYDNQEKIVVPDKRNTYSNFVVTTKDNEKIEITSQYDIRKFLEKIKSFGSYSEDLQYLLEYDEDAFDGEYHIKAYVNGMNEEQVEYLDEIIDRNR